MDKGIENTRGGHVEITSAATVLNPGLNRVSEEQMKLIRADKMGAIYFEQKILREVEAPPVPTKPEDAIPADELGNDAREPAARKTVKKPASK